MAKDKPDLTQNNEIISYPLGELMEDRFGRYAKYIIQDRALPDVRDGLKPVQRRILYGMSELKIFYNKPTLKSARIVGDVMGKYHPHGDSSIYEAMVRMSQEWKMGVPLVRMQGNNGSIDGDSAAAYRYTEAKLQKIAELLLSDLDKDTVEFAPNYDDKLKEPTVLPAYFPNILVNGSTGIAAGYATNMPPHNLNEVIDVVVAFIKNPDLTLKEALKYIKGPDFPTGGIIQGVTGIKQAFQTGKGKVILNSKWHEEKNVLIIDEIPYEVIKQDLVKNIGEVADDNPGLEIKEVIDESGREHPIRIAIYLSHKANLEVVRKVLFKQTNLSISYNYNNVVIIDKQPRQVGILEIMTSYVRHYVDVYTKKTKFNLQKAQSRLEIVEGLIKATSILDEVIKTIRASDNRGNAITNLVSTFSFTQPQAEAIVDMQLYRLTSTDVSKLEQEQGELSAAIKQYQTLLADSTVMNEAIIADLKKVKAEYGIPRRSVIEEEVENLEVEVKDTVVEKEMHLYLSRDGYLKAISYDVAGKNTPETFGRKPGDLWIYHQEVSNMDQLIAVSNQGNYYSIPLFKLQFSKWKDYGIHINEFATMDGEEVVLDAFVIHDFATAKGQLLLGTKRGLTKRVVINDLETKSFNKSFRIIKLAPDDELVSASLISPQANYVGVITKTGYGVRYGLEDIPIQGVNSKGVKALSRDEEIISVVGLSQGQEILFLTNRDDFKKIDQDMVPMYVRPKRGVRLFQERKNQEELITRAFGVTSHDQLVLLNKDDEVKTIELTKTKPALLTGVTTSLGFKQVVDGYVTSATLIDPHQDVLGSEEYLGEQSVAKPSATFQPKIKNTKKVNPNGKLKVDEQLNQAIERKVNSLGSSLFDDFDFESADQTSQEEDTQLNFEDLLTDENDN